jgi:hypothetical protein
MEERMERRASYELPKHSIDRLLTLFQEIATPEILKAISTTFPLQGLELMQHLNLIENAVRVQRES